MSSDSRSEWPIVVGGCHRTGTSLVRRILDSHSRIHCGPEVKFFSDFYGDRFPDGWRMFRYIESAGALVGGDDLFEVLGASFVELHRRAARAAGKARWADKAPENVLYCPQWHRLLGDRWVLVHVLRNPLDTIASIGQAPFYDIPRDLDGRVQHYRTYVEAGLRFGAEHPDRYQAVVYEELVTRPSATLQALMSWLGESFESQQLAFNDQPHQPGIEDPKVAGTTGIHTESLHRWRSVLAREQAELIWERTSELWSEVDPDGRFVAAPTRRASAATP